MSAHVITDDNGNSATVSYWGSEESARASLATLTNCSHCLDCSYCSDCSRCSRCSECSRCLSCSHCLDCSYCSDCSRCSRCSECSRCLDCSYCLEGYIHGVLGGYGWWVDPKTGRARVGCQERDDWEALSRDDIAKMSHDGAQWYDRYYAAWCSIIANCLDTEANA